VDVPIFNYRFPGLLIQTDDSVNSPVATTIIIGGGWSFTINT